MIASLFLGALLAAGGADWPQWRGPNRDGVVTAVTRIYVHTRDPENEVVAALGPGTGKML